MIQYLVKCPVCSKMNLKKENGSESQEYEYFCKRCTYFASLKDGVYMSGISSLFPIEYQDRIQELNLDIYEF